MRHAPLLAPISHARETLLTAWPDLSGPGVGASDWAGSIRAEGPPGFSVSLLTANSGWSLEAVVAVS